MDIPCPRQSCEGIIEASSKIYFDAHGKLERHTVKATDIELSHVNDMLPDGTPVNIEGELFVGCSDCSDEFELDIEALNIQRQGPR